ncbi:MAG: asparaginase [Candidatus Cybelea sp.]
MTSDRAIVVEVTRGELVESIHRVAACAVDAAGREIYSAGDVEMLVYLRSTAKPFIAAAAIEAGAREAFGLDEREIAVMAASHFGEPMHVEAVRSILRKIGMDVSDLRCGTHPPYDDGSAKALLLAGERPTALHNNCSGKHAGILGLCKLIGADPATYLSAQNPAQRRILELCARLSDDDPQTWPIGVDGCGIPVYATTLRQAARSFARFASLSEMLDSDAQALRVVRDAMVAHPEYVAGTGQFDTELMRAGRGALAAKAGAEGVHGVAAIARGYGYVSKVIDGGSRGRGPSSVAVLRRIGVLDEPQCAELERFAHPAVYNRAGEAVGEIRAIV